jgi:hypothetical protein
LTCILCNSRKARRRCPAAQGDICPQCCAEQREQTLDCPLDCEHLIESRRHEKLTGKAAGAALHPEVRITDEFMSRNDMLLRFLSVSVGSAALDTPGVTDADVREGMDAVIQTLKTAGSGLIYETRPANPFAAGVQEKINAQIERLRKGLAEQSGAASLRDKDILGVLVFLARVAASVDNGRRKGRAFLSTMRDQWGIRPKTDLERLSTSEVPPSSGLIITP